MNILTDGCRLAILEFIFPFNSGEQLGHFRGAGNRILREARPRRRAAQGTVHHQEPVVRGFVICSWIG